MSGVVIFSPESSAPRDRPMVIQQAHRIPEVRLYPPESSDHQGNAENVAQNNVPGNPPWLPVLPVSERWIFSEDMPPPEAVDNSSTAYATENWYPFHMRPANLTAFTSSQHSYRNTYRPHGVAVQRARSGWESNAAKSLDLVRQNLQQHMNKELSDVIKRYVDKFFNPAIENIKRNNGESAVSEEHVHAVCKQILEEAKRMYVGPYTRGSTPLGDNSDSETGSHSEGRMSVVTSKGRKRKDSDTDSEASQTTLRPFKKKGRQPIHFFGGLSGRVTPSKQGKASDHIKKEGPKWEPSRLNKDTHFVMGARANKALGYGATRGRLYIRHPDLFKYCGDADDKQWLYENNMMPATGGKAYMLILDDIKELTENEEYRNSPGLLLDELLGFPVPEHMLEKMRASMNAQRTNHPERKPRGRPSHAASTSALLHQLQHPLLAEYSSASPGDNSNGILKHSGVESSGPTSPAEELDMLTHNRSSSRTSQFVLPAGLEDVSPVQVEAPPSPDLQSEMDPEPPLSAPFDIRECR